MLVAWRRRFDRAPLVLLSWAPKQRQKTEAETKAQARMDTLAYEVRDAKVEIKSQTNRARETNHWRERERERERQITRKSQRERGREYHKYNANEPYLKLSPSLSLSPLSLRPSTCELPLAWKRCHLQHMVITFR